jgi:hypothetical protein
LWMRWWTFGFWRHGISYVRPKISYHCHETVVVLPWGIKTPRFLNSAPGLCNTLVVIKVF